jgi:hypothetical protein
MDKIDQLEKEMAQVNKSLEIIEGNLETLLRNVDKINVGLYGDEKNDHPGVIERLKELERRMNEKDIIDKEQTAGINARKELKITWWTILKIVGGIIGSGVAWYLVFKGSIGADNLLKF